MALTAAVTVACATAEVQLPTPRRLVLQSGERLAPTKADMEEVDAWVREQMDSIELDPSFMIYTTSQDAPAYPWENLEVSARGDTARIGAQGRVPDIFGPYTLYAHLHLMAAQGRLDRWLPEAPKAADFELERAILSRVADAWVYQRSIFDAQPYELLDELAYAKANDFLDAFILVSRPDAFVEARRSWMAEHPDQRSAYLSWFRNTFERDPPGLRGAGRGG